MATLPRYFVLATRITAHFVLLTKRFGPGLCSLVRRHNLATYLPIILEYDIPLMPPSAEESAAASQR